MTKQVHLYQEISTSFYSIVELICASLFAIIGFAILDGMARSIVLVLLALWAIASIVFLRLELTVTPDFVTWGFWGQLFKKRLIISEIERVTIARCSWKDGCGIHRIQSGWLYNVSFGKALVIQTRKAESFTIQTERAEEVASIIQEMWKKGLETDESG